jgi:predicted RNase H-like HicB family nuclease
MKYLIIIEKTKRGYSAYLPDLAGCVAAGRSRPGVERSMRNALQMHLEAMRAGGSRVPRPKTTSSYVEV